MVHYSGIVLFRQRKQVKSILLLFLLLTSMFANIGKITAIKGEVLIQRDSQDFLVKLGTELKKSDTIKTKTNARAQLVFTDNTIVSIGKSSIFSIEDYLFESKKPAVAKFKFGNGVFKTITGKIGKINPKKFTLTTKTASIGIRGTIVGIESKDEVDIILVPQGRVEVSTPDGIILVNEGEMVETAVGVKPEVKAIPPATQEKLEQDSGATSNEQESGQGEATQTTVLTQEEQEEAKGQQAAEEEQQKEEASQKQDKESTQKSEEEPAQESTQDNQETQSEEPSQNTEPDPVTDDVQTEVVLEDTAVEVLVEEPAVNIDPEVDAPIVDIDTIVPPDILTIVPDVEPATPEPVVLVDPVEPTTTEPTTTTEATTTDTTESVAETTTTNLSGYHLGAATSSRITSNNFKVSGSSSPVVTGDNFDLSAYTLEKYSDGVTSSETIDGAFSYDGFTSDVTTISYSREIEGTSNPLQYTIHDTDSTAEFVVGYTSVDDGTIEYDSLFYAGVKSDKILDSSSIYEYKGFKELNIFTSSTNNIERTDVDGVQDIASDSVYINTLTKSMYFTTYSDLYNGEYQYNAGYLDTTDNSVTFKIFNLRNSSTNIGDADGQLYGTSAQAIGLHSTQTEYYNYGLLDFDPGEESELEAVEEESEIGEYNGVHTFEFDNKSSVSNSGTATLTGYSNYFLGNSETGYTPLSLSTLSLSINRDTGAISSTITDDVNDFELSLNGTPGESLSSYYINDDLFGVLAVHEGSFMGEDGQLIENTGFLVSVPDDYNDGNYQTLDDESSWGYWTASFSDDMGYPSSYNIGPRSTWVAGVETSSSFIDGLINNETTQTVAVFDGHVLGAVINYGEISPILFDENNNVNFTFSFGAGSAALSGSMSFHAGDSSTWSVNVTESTVSSSGFDGTLSDALEGGVSGSLDGKYFGTGEIKSVGGKFNLADESSSASGVFKANKTSQTISSTEGIQ